MSSSTGERHAVDESVLDLVTNLARYLIAAGFKVSRFSELTRLAFYNAAANHARFGNDKLNQSAVAAMTGLTRVQVRQFAKKHRVAPSHSKDQLNVILDTWNSDSHFTERDRNPRRLRILGPGPTFTALVRRCGSDIPVRSILRELQRRDLVRIRSGYVSLKATAGHNRDEARLRRAAYALNELLKEKGGTLPQAPFRSLNFEAFYPAPSEKARVLLQRRTADGLRAFVHGIEAAGAAAAIDSPPSAKRGKRITRLRVALVTEDIEN